MNSDGTFRMINLFGKDLCGKDLYNQLERSARKAFSLLMRKKNNLAEIFYGFCGMVQILLYMAEIK